MSVLPPKADIRQREWHVRYVPIAAVASSITRLPMSGSLSRDTNVNYFATAMQGDGGLGLNIRAAGSRPVVVGNSPEV